MTGARLNNPSPRRRGLTTLELLVALAITSVTGLGVAAVITSVARGITVMNETRGVMQRAHAAHLRLRSYADPALCLLQTDSRGLALWLHDDRANGQVNLSELRIVWFEPAESDDDEIGGELVLERVDWPESMDEAAIEAADIVLTPADDMFRAMELARSLGYTTRQALADGVSSFSSTYTAATPRESVRFTATLALASAGSDVEEVLISFGLPSHEPPE